MRGSIYINTHTHRHTYTVYVTLNNICILYAKKNDGNIKKNSTVAQYKTTTTYKGGGMLPQKKC